MKPTTADKLTFVVSHRRHREANRRVLFAMDLLAAARDERARRRAEALYAAALAALKAVEADLSRRFWEDPGRSIP
jgi:hypothetical protein